MERRPCYWDCICYWVSEYVTEYGKSLIFQLLPDVLDWYHGVIISVNYNKLITASTTHFDLHKGLLSRRVSLRSLHPVRRYQLSCHCFQTTNRNWLKIRFSQSSPPCLNWVGRLLGTRLSAIGQSKVCWCEGLRSLEKLHLSLVLIVPFICYINSLVIISN